MTESEKPGVGECLCQKSVAFCGQSHSGVILAVVIVEYHHIRDILRHSYLLAHLLPHNPARLMWLNICFSDEERRAEKFGTPAKFSIVAKSVIPGTKIIWTEILPCPFIDRVSLDKVCEASISSLTIINNNSHSE